MYFKISVIINDWANIDPSSFTCYFHPPLSSKKFEINTESWAIDRQTLQLNLAIFLQARLNVG